MPTVHHPTIPDVSRDVPASALSRWLAQGWVTDAPRSTPTRSQEPKRRAPRARTKTPRATT